MFKAVIRPKRASIVWIHVDTRTEGCALRRLTFVSFVLLLSWVLTRQERKGEAPLPSLLRLFFLFGARRVFVLRVSIMISREVWTRLHWRSFRFLACFRFVLVDVMEDSDSCSSRAMAVDSSPTHGQKQKQKIVEVYEEVRRRLKSRDNEEARRPGFDDELWAHFSRLPTRYWNPKRGLYWLLPAFSLNNLFVSLENQMICEEEIENLEYALICEPYAYEYFEFDSIAFSFWNSTLLKCFLKFVSLVEETTRSIFYLFVKRFLHWRSASWISIISFLVSEVCTNFDCLWHLHGIHYTYLNENLVKSKLPFSFFCRIQILHLKLMHLNFWSSSSWWHIRCLISLSCLCNLFILLKYRAKRKDLIFRNYILFFVLLFPLAFSLFLCLSVLSFSFHFEFNDLTQISSSVNAIIFYLMHAFTTVFAFTSLSLAYFEGFDLLL